MMVCFGVNGTLLKMCILAEEGLLRNLDLLVCLLFSTPLLSNKVSLCSPGWPRIYYVALAGLEFIPVHLPQPPLVPGLSHHT